MVYVRKYTILDVNVREGDRRQTIALRRMNKYNTDRATHCGSLSDSKSNQIRDNITFSTINLLCRFMIINKNAKLFGETLFQRSSGYSGKH